MARSVCDGWENLSVRRRIASQLVGNNLQRWPLLMFQDLAKEAFGGFPVSMACDQDIEDFTILIHRSPEIVAFAADGDEQLVHMPDVTEAPLSLPHGAGIRWSEFAAPGSNRFAGPP